MTERKCGNCKHHDAAHPVPLTYFMSGRTLTCGVYEYLCLLHESLTFKSDSCPDFDPTKEDEPK